MLPRSGAAPAWALAGPAPLEGLLGAAGRAVLLQPGLALSLAFAIVFAIDVLRFAMPPEVRLAFLYMAPVALATWGAGRIAGHLTVLLAITTGVAANILRGLPLDHVFAANVVLLLGAMVIFVQIVSRVRDALVRSDQRLLWVLDGLADALYVTDEGGAVLYGNRRFTALFRRGAEPRTQRDVASRLVPIGGSADARRGAGVEVRDGQDGRRFRLQSRIIPWVGMTHVELHVLTDLTEEAGAADRQAAAPVADRHADRANDMGETASILAHELNQPLVALVGYNAACLRLLEAEPLDRTALAAALEKSRAQAMRAGEIVHRMREIARRRVPRVAPTNLNAVVREQLAALAPEMARAGIMLDTSLAAALPDVECDGVLVGQVLRNLVDNAIDAMLNSPQGDRRLHVATAAAAGPGARITVADRGHGIAPDVAERMYRPFFTTRSTGLGLGLAICRSIAIAHGGRLWHEPRPGGGTAFHFTLP